MYIEYNKYKIFNKYKIKIIVVHLTKTEIYHKIKYNENNTNSRYRKKKEI